MALIVLEFKFFFIFRHWPIFHVLFSFVTFSQNLQFTYFNNCVQHKAQLNMVFWRGLNELIFWLDYIADGFHD